MKRSSVGRDEKPVGEFAEAVDDILRDHALILPEGWNRWHVWHPYSSLICHSLGINVLLGLVMAEQTVSQRSFSIYLSVQRDSLMHDVPTLKPASCVSDKEALAEANRYG